ncbi:MAG: hypothetical protein NVS3B19_01180 [Ginsengibacter sp.]
MLGSVLYIAAHPDDENNGLLPWLAKEKLYRTGYLSLTRGDGGQNLIGSEQGVELGLIRTQELLAARRIDGAEQYFSTAYEFGFSKSSEEALKIWGHDKILSDVVWVVRQYQPDVIITRFPGDKRAGHGHHAASSILANEAFTAAADPTKFPEQFKYGVKPWQAKRILWNTFNFGNTNTTSEDQLKYDVGTFNPLLGKSYGEIGGEARSMHKSQGEGRPRRKGQINEYFTNLGGPAPKHDLMDDIDYSWSRISGGAAVQGMISDISKNFRIDQPELSVPALCKLYISIQTLPDNNWKQIKLNELQNIIEECSGLFIDATTQLPAVVQGQDFPVTIFINKRQNIEANLNRISINNYDSNLNSSLKNNANVSLTHMIHVDDAHPISQPYWLKYPQKDGSFDVRDQTLIGKAENPAEYNSIISVNINGVDFNITRPVMFKTVDPVKGELYEPLVILPKEEVSFAKSNYISADGQTVNVTGNIIVNSNPTASVTSKLSNPPNWKPVGDYNVSSVNKNTFRSYQKLKPAIKNSNNAGVITLDAELNNTTYSFSRKTIAYDHIPVITYFNRAQANLVNIDLKTTPANIGYIVGAGDKVPEELQQMGYKVTFLTEPDITDENLKNFDAIIIGIRAFNIYEYLSDKNDVLNRFVKNGGNLIAQYIKSNFIGDKKINIGPYPFSINAGTRVTEENAPVKFLIPDHPVLNYPNKITDKDFEGWVQERSTYQADKADNNYIKPLGMNDTGEPQSHGSLLIAKYGKGNFVYMSLVLFRELPAGVPGAYRLMANCVALPKN